MAAKRKHSETRQRRKLAAIRLSPGEHDILKAEMARTGEDGCVGAAGLIPGFGYGSTYQGGGGLTSACALRACSAYVTGAVPAASAARWIIQSCRCGCISTARSSHRSRLP